MSSSAGPLRSARAPGADWQDSFYNLDERYRELQKRFNEQQEELKRAKVSQQKVLTAVERNRRGATGDRPNPRPGVATRAQSFSKSNPASRTAQPSPSPSSPVGQDDVREVQDYVAGAPPSVRWDGTRAGVLHAASLLGTDPGAALPDPAMVWGSEGSIQNYVAASALYHANEELRRKLEESTTLVNALQKELSSTRTLCTTAQARIDDLAQQMHQLVRERDLASQKLAAAKLSIGDFERTLTSRVHDEEKTRFSLERQIAELRSRLVAGADSNELLSRDVRALLSDVKEKTSEVVSLRSKLALAESGLSSQRNTNENLLLELRNLNTQLVEERKRLLVAAREVQSAALVQDRVGDLEGQVRRLSVERAAVEKEHTELMGHFVRVTEDALRHAREEVRADLQDWRGAAQHWEMVAQLLYKDVSERTRAHIHCREQCDEAKAQRDLVGVQLRAATEELALCRAKLEVVWPSHSRDAEGLTADEVLETFRRRSAAVKQDGVSGEDASAPAPPQASTYAAALAALPVDQTTSAERVSELQEANAALMADLEQLVLTNEMLQDRLTALGVRHNDEQEKTREVAKAAETREQAGRRVLEQQLDRVQFLEAQVHSLRGYQVSPNIPLQEVSPSDTVLELFLGQLVGAVVPEQMEVAAAFGQVFCSADFLLHETVTTPTITGLNGFFDTTISFCISMDALLLYYLQSRELLVQLHRVRDSAEVAAAVEAADESDEERPARQRPLTAPPGSTADASLADTEEGHQSVKMAERMFETVAEGRVSLVDIVRDPSCRDAARPTLKGHVRLTTPSGLHLASLEFQLIARTPFTPEFRHLAQEATVAPVRAASPSEGTPTTSSAAGGTHKPGSAAPAAGAVAGAHDAAADADRESSSDASSHAGVLEWLRRSARATTGPRGTEAPDALTETQPLQKHSRHKHRTPPVGPPSASSSSSSSGMQLVRTQVGTASAASHSSSPPVGDKGRARTRDGSGVAAPATPAWESYPARQLAPSSAAPGGFTHIARTLLGLAPDGLEARGRHGEAPIAQGIHSVAVDVVRLELPADLPTPIPRLSCYYAVPALHREVRLQAPTSPQYTVVYEQSDGALGTVFTVPSVSELAMLAREPLTFFLIDEDAGLGAVSVWGMALCEWTQVLSSPEQPLTLSLPLLQQQQLSKGGRGGTLERTLVRGGALVVQLVASVEASPLRLTGSGVAGTDVGLGAPVSANTALAPNTGSSPAPTVGVVEAVGLAPPPPLPPSPLTALQQLMLRVQQPGGSHTATPTPWTGATVPRSMDEQLMEMEYARMTQR